MIDRLEMFTSENMQKARMRFTSGLRYTSKLIEEDEDVKILKYQHGGVLYDRLYVETFSGNARTGEMSDDPTSFYVFTSPRFRRNKTHEFKIVLNPSRVTISQMLDFLQRCFWQQEHKLERLFYQKFRLGRIDFAVDVHGYSVEELRRMIYVANKTRKHTSIFSLADDGSGYIRIISAKEPETFYIGKGDVVLRVYNKKLEAQYRIAVCKREGRKVPERLQQIADLPQLTRIELQIRSLGTMGIKEHDGIKSSSLKRGFYRLTNLWELINLKEKSFDVFDDILFNPTQETDYFSTYWQNEAFNALIRERGFDTAIKCLEPDKRREVVRYLHEKKFTENLNEICYREVKQWLSN